MAPALTWNRSLTSLPFQKAEKAEKPKKPKKEAKAEGKGGGKKPEAEERAVDVSRLDLRVGFIREAKLHPGHCCLPILALTHRREVSRDLLEIFLQSLG